MTVKASQREENTSELSRLSREMIIAAGMEIASRPGCTTVTVRDLGKQLGVDPTAIYRHFRNKNELMSALLDRLISVATDRSTVDPKDWKDALRELADNVLDVYLDYPAVAAEAATLSTNGSAELDGIEFILGCLSKAGLEGDQLIEYYQLFSSHMLAFGSVIAQSRGAKGKGAYIPATVAATHASHPTTTKYREQLLALDERSVYRTGIRMILDCAEAAA